MLADSKVIAARSAWLHAGFAAALCLALLLPAAGTYGLWDPWEPHYAEVTRQLLLRGDAVSLEWYGASWEGPEFWSKPPLTFWLLALSFRAAGVGTTAQDLLSDHRVEWAARLVPALCAAVAVAALVFLVARLWTTRAARWAGVTLLSFPMFLLLGRQAITDMPLVASICVGVCGGAIALWGDAQPVRPGRWGFVAAFVAAGSAPFLAHATWVLGPLVAASRAVGLGQMAPWWLALAWLLVRLRRVKSSADFALVVGAVGCALGMLAKGLLGLLPAVVLVVTLLATRTLRRMVGLDWVSAVLAFLVVAGPWHAAMGFVHGEDWFDTFFRDHHFGRLSGWGVFEDLSWVMYVRVLGYACFPLGGLAIGAITLAPRGRRPVLVTLGLVWAGLVFAIITTSLTRYHHYALPLVPAIALLAAIFIDALLSSEVDAGPGTALLAVVVAPIAGLILRDLSQPDGVERLIWLFDYSYKLHPVHDWLATHDFSGPVYGLGMLAIAGLALAAVRGFRRLGLAVGVAASIALGLFVLDVALPELGPEYSTRDALAVWQRKRAPGDALWLHQFFSRGDTFYSANAAFDAPYEEQTVFHKTDPTSAKRREVWLRHHPGVRVFVLTWSPGVEGTLWKQPSLLSQLPEGALRSLRWEHDDGHHALISFIVPTGL
ncbi:MAG: glycosyltransferase family 39 protein [Myxococcaceae bacterium]